MTVARHYIVYAAEGRTDELDTALRNLADAVRAVAGCHGVDVMRDLEDERRYVFIEKWESVEVYKASLAKLPNEVVAPMMAALDGPPQAAYLDLVAAL
ncbi:putative quinol monooxygenase [Mycobacterium sp.]|uniref:putative quinol monooxygenase n=1 Tax=Mycobacterium sp. TaxID=1785 RepID=UPI002DB549AF|nr:antibiotic biosynthesis monooxygenase [Mycobacterium sp.]